MRISKLTDYGTIVMVYLARNEQNLSNSRDVAFHTNLSVPTVSKLLKRLTGAGLLISVRGVAGGYRLQRSAHAISIADIMNALEKQQGLIECSLKPNNCTLQHVCNIQNNWQLISHAINNALDNISLAMLAMPAMPLAVATHIERLVSSGVNRSE